MGILSIVDTTRAFVESYHEDIGLPDHTDWDIGPYKIQSARLRLQHAQSPDENRQAA